MKVELFSVYDLASARFMDPFNAPTIEFALRGFKEACGTVDHQFRKYPEDYLLYHVGEFDPDHGLVAGWEPRQIAKATNFIHGVQLELEDQIREEEQA